MGSSQGGKGAVENNQASLSPKGLPVPLLSAVRRSVIPDVDHFLFLQKI